MTYLHFTSPIPWRDWITEEVLATVAEGRKENVDLAVKVAREALDNGPWPRLSGEARRKILLKFADLIEENADEIATLEVVDTAKPFQIASDFQAYTLREPIGVVGHIIPWNAPAYLFAMKVAPALAAGCTVVIKPAENTPLVGLFMTYLSKLAGVPDGVINVVNGFGSTAGAAVSSHMDIDAVTFYFLLVNITSICFAIQLTRYQSRLLLRVPPKVGRTVMQAAAESNLKPVSLELRGKSPFIVFDDADIEKAAEIAVLGNLSNKGEMCVAGSRVFVHEGIYDAFVKKLEATVKIWEQETF
ncbi:aldehyde dehydrogenase family 2 member C4-like protein [Tanacetum coccineum]